MRVPGRLQLATPDINRAVERLKTAASVLESSTNHYF
jgi:hypothetical protein